MPVSIFFCYAREDEALLNKLKSHLSPLQRQGLIKVWHDRDISAGTEWEKEINKHLNTSQITLLLISPDFMDSDYCYGVEMKRALERHENGEAKVIPIILRPTYWHEEPLGKLQALPTDGKPVTDPDWHNLDRAFYDITKGIYRVVKQLTGLHTSDLPVIPAITLPPEPVPPPLSEDVELPYVPPISLPPPEVKLLPVTVFTRKQEEHVSSESAFVIKRDRASQLSLSADNSVSPSSRLPRSEPSVPIPQVPGTRLFIYDGHPKGVNAVVWSPDGKRLASASDDWTVQVWDINIGHAPPLTYRGHSNSVNAVAWSPDGKRLASASDDCTVQVWDASTGRYLFTYCGHNDPVKSVAWSPDSKRLASAGTDWTVQVWDASTGSNLLPTYEGHSEWVVSVAWSPNGERLASASFDKTVQVWDASTGSNLLPTYEGHSEWVASVAWSPNGQWLASASFDKTVQVWDASTGSNLLPTYEGHSEWVASVAWSPNGQWLASASNDKTVQVWDAVSSGSPPFAYQGHSDLVRSVAWSPDGKRLASASNDCTVQVWEG